MAPTSVSCCLKRSDPPTSRCAALCPMPHALCSLLLPTDNGQLTTDGPSGLAVLCLLPSVLFDLASNLPEADKPQAQGSFKLSLRSVMPYAPCSLLSAFDNGPRANRQALLSSVFCPLSSGSCAFLAFLAERSDPPTHRPGGCLMCYVLNTDLSSLPI